jgi:hypothetical protein
MNIVNYTIENELLSSRYLGTKKHRTLPCRQRQISVSIDHNHKPPDNGDKNTFSLSTSKSIFNSNHFTAKIPFILKEHELTVYNCNINKIFASKWIDDRKCIMGTKCNKM